MNFLLLASSIPPPPLVFVAPNIGGRFQAIAKLVAGYDTSNFDSITIKRGRENLAQVEQVHEMFSIRSHSILSSASGVSNNIGGFYMRKIVIISNDKSYYSRYEYERKKIRTRSFISNFSKNRSIERIRV